MLKCFLPNRFSSPSQQIFTKVLIFFCAAFFKLNSAAYSSSFQPVSVASVFKNPIKMIMLKLNQFTVCPMGEAVFLH